MRTRTVAPLLSRRLGTNMLHSELVCSKGVIQGATLVQFSKKPCRDCSKGIGAEAEKV